MTLEEAEHVIGTCKLLIRDEDANNLTFTGEAFGCIAELFDKFPVIKGSPAEKLCEFISVMMKYCFTGAQKDDKFDWDSVEDEFCDALDLLWELLQVR